MGDSIYIFNGTIVGRRKTWPSAPEDDGENSLEKVSLNFVFLIFESYYQKGDLFIFYVKEPDIFLSEGPRTKNGNGFLNFQNWKKKKFLKMIWK